MSQSIIKGDLESNKSTVSNDEKTQIKTYIGKLSNSNPEEKQLIEFLKAWMDYKENDKSLPEQYLAEYPTKADFQIDPEREGVETLDLVLGNNEQKFVFRVDLNENILKDKMQRRVKIFPLNGKQFSGSIKDVSGKVAIGWEEKNKKSFLLENTDRDYTLDIPTNHGESLKIPLGDLIDLVGELAGNRNGLEKNKVALDSKTTNNDTTQGIIGFIKDKLSANKILRLEEITSDPRIPSNLRVENNTVKINVQVKNLVLKNPDINFTPIQVYSLDESQSEMQKLESNLFTDNSMEVELELSLYTVDRLGERKEKIQIEKDINDNLIAKVPDGERFAYSVKILDDKANNGLSLSQATDGDVYLVKRKIAQKSGLGENSEIPTNILKSNNSYYECFKSVGNKAHLTKGIELNKNEINNALSIETHSFIAKEAQDSESKEPKKSAGDKLTIHIGEAIYHIPANENKTETLLIENVNKPNRFGVRGASSNPPTKKAEINFGEAIKSSGKLNSSASDVIWSNTIPITIKVIDR